MRACALFLLSAAGTFAQPLRFGIIAGVPVHGLLTAAASGYRAGTGYYTLGPAVEVSLAYRLAFEADLLYKHVSYASLAGTGDTGRWELPLIARYHFGGPFLGVGVSFNHLTGFHDARIVESRHRGTMGFVAGAGIEKRWGRLRLAPEIRFTRWVDRNFGVFDAPLRSNLTQVELLVGLSF